MKIKHKVVKFNSEDQIEKILWTEEYESFEFARLYYELQRQTVELKVKNTEDYAGIFECNDHQWFYGLDKCATLPSGDMLYFDNYEPTKIELDYFLNHSEKFLQKMSYTKDHGDGFSMEDHIEESWLAGSNPRFAHLNGPKIKEQKYEFQLNKNLFELSADGLSCRFGFVENEKYNQEIRSAFEIILIEDLSEVSIGDDDYILVFSEIEYGKNDLENIFLDVKEYNGAELNIKIQRADLVFKSIGKLYLQNWPIDEIIGVKIFKTQKDAEQFLNATVALLKSPRKNESKI